MARIRQIEASAGSGKTYRLTHDFLELLAKASDTSWSTPPAGCRLPVDGSYGWQEILAATFTNKAAGEMRDRILQRLKECALELPEALEDWTPGRARAALEALLQNYSALNIRTIDSLLHLLVRLSALDFGMTPDFEPYFSTEEITEPVFDLMAEEARSKDQGLAGLFRSACARLLNSEKVQGFLAGNSMRSEITKLVALMLENEDGDLGGLASPEEAEKHIQDMFADFKEAAGALQSELKAEKLEAHAHLVNALNKCVSAKKLDDLPLDSKMLCKPCLDDALKKNSKGKASEKSCELYASLCGAARNLTVLKGASGIMPYVDLARALFLRLKDYERRNAVLAACQIPELALRAAGEEGDINALFCRMGSRITHLLIDEFQDTSRTQWKVLRPLVEEAISRGGSLTFVGDVKQAIYGWRGGDASLFEEVPKELTAPDEEPECTLLPYNWRSRERIVDWNNDLFSPLGDSGFCRNLLAPLAEGDEELLDEQAELLRNAFSDAKQNKPKECKPGGFVQLHALRKEKKTDEESGSGEDDEDSSSSPEGKTEKTNKELLRLLPDLVENLGRRHRWGHLCILVRSNKQAEVVTSWLMERQIPVVTQGSLTLSSQPVIAGMVELLRFLNCPDDDLAFWAVLQGRDLIPPSAPSGLPFPTVEELNDWAASHCDSPGKAQQFRQDYPELWQELFAPLYDSGGLLTAYDTAAEILARWQVLERNPQAECFIRRFLEILFQAEEKGIADLSAFLELWDSKGNQEKAPLPEKMDAVSIMTMHKAKGLQFDVVLLPWPLSSERSPHETVLWDSHGTKVLAPLCKAMGQLYRRRVMEEAREALHLIYVGMTRAISELYCFLPDPDTGKLPFMLNHLVSKLCPDLQKNRDFSWGDLPAAPQPCAAPSDPPAMESRPELPPARPLPEAPDWRPMAWLPRLRIFHSHLDEWTFSPAQRGTLIHHCLEYLQITGNSAASAAEDARKAAVRGLSTFPLLIPDRDAVLKDVTDCLTWYASLPESAHWLAFGDPEHALLDENGHNVRVDLLVNDGKELIAVEYKTGSNNELPVEKHEEQLSNYLNLLSQASELPVRGVLVYLDRQKVFPLSAGGSHARP